MSHPAKRFMKPMLLVVLIVFVAITYLPFGHAQSKSMIYLVDNTGAEVLAGKVIFSNPADGRTGIAVSMDGPKFTEHFLSMRPFRCIENEKEWFCHLPYPYDLKNTIGDDDLLDLEYNLLFIRKKPAEFGIDAWNGLYYRLTRQENGEIQGKLMEGDLNVLASPPGEAYARPIDLGEFIEADKNARLFPRLIIR